MKNGTFALAITLALTATSCNNDDGEIFIAELPVATTSKLRHDSITESLKSLSNGEVRVFTLPAPLQITTALSNLDVRFDETLLISDDAPLIYPKQTLKAQNLGIASINLGYCCINNKQDGCIVLLERVSSLVEALGIRNSFNPSLAQRFMDYIENQDSVSRLILEGYEEAHTYFRDNNNEALGLTIVSGALVEGIFLSSAPSSVSTAPELYTLMGQQKVYLENCIVLLNRFTEGDESKHIINALSELFKQFGNIEEVKDEAPDMAKVRVPANFQKSLENIHQTASNYRNEILKG